MSLKYCKRCDRVGNYAEIETHNYIENNLVVCKFALAQKCLVCREPAHADRKCPLASAFVEDTIFERRKNAIRKMSNYSYERKAEIAEWMVKNTPIGEQIDAEWRPYLMKNVSHKNVKTKAKK